MAGLLDEPRARVGKMGLREDGTPKGFGWLGTLIRPDGDVSTELSVSSDLFGKETSYPLLVPGLTPQEMQYLLTAEPGPRFFQNMPPGLFDKATAHAAHRIKQGKSPFRQTRE
jgi:hypothetical protein